MSTPDANGTNKPDDGGPAFPVMWEWAEGETGMSLRDAAALKALPAIIETLGSTSLAYEEFRQDQVRRIAEAAFAVADAMIAERSKSQEQGQ